MFQTTRMPANRADINNFCTKGKSSIVQNLPAPVSFVKHDHVCVSLKEVFAHFLAFGVSNDAIVPDWVKSKTGSDESNNNCKLVNPLHATKQMQMILDEIHSDECFKTAKPFVFCLIFWSDDFEVNRTRKNRNSIWVKTVTICPPIDCFASSLHTQATAMSAKGIDHQPIHEYFEFQLSDLKKLNFLHSKEHNSNVPVVVRVLAVAADRPERSSINCTSSHNGLSTS